MQMGCVGRRRRTSRLMYASWGGGRLIIKARKDINTTGSAPPPAYTRPDPTNKKSKKIMKTNMEGSLTLHFRYPRPFPLGGGGMSKGQPSERLVRKKVNELRKGK